MRFAMAALAGFLSTLSFTMAFRFPNVRRKAFVSRTMQTSVGYQCSISRNTNRRNTELRTRQCTTTARHMYSLPPGGGGKKDDLQTILAGVGTIAATLLFFASPLGSIFFAITNSLFLLALLLPVVGIVGFQVWQAFYTLEGPCPNCGAPCRVLKDSSSTGPSLCFNCGAVVQASSSQNEIEIARESTVVDDGFSSSGSIFDILMSQQIGSRPDAPNSINTVKEKQSKYRRESTIIDVEVERD